MNTDDGPGIAAALAGFWPETAVQRCLVHVRGNVRTYLTGRPRTEAGRALLRLGRALTRITSAAEAAAWLGGLNDWHQTYGHLVRARTYRGNNTLAPAWVRANQTWWFTHDRLRKAYRLLERLSQAGTLSTYLRTEFAGLDIAATTNRIEAGTNAQLRLILRSHRGMSKEHQKRAIEWYLYLHSENPVPPAGLTRPEHHTPTRTPAHAAVEPPADPSNTARAPSPRWVPGPAQDGQDAPDTPGIHTRLVL